MAGQRSPSLPPGVERPLFPTANANSIETGAKDFRRDFVALTADGGHWTVDRKMRAVGVDYLSVQRFDEGPETHEILLEAGIVIVEGLALEK